MDIQTLLTRLNYPEALTPDLTRCLLQDASTDEQCLAERILALCRFHPKASRGLISVIMDQLEEASLLGSPHFDGRVQALEPEFAETALGAWFLAHYSEKSARPGKALHWYENASLTQGSSPEILLDLARVSHLEGQSENACLALRRLATGSSDFGLLSRAARLLGRLKIAAPSTCSHALRIALLHPYTTVLWTPLLQLALFREGIWADIHVPPYGTHEQAILDPASSLYSFQPDLVILAPTWKELLLPAFSNDPHTVVKDLIEGIVHRWEILQSRLSARIIQHNFEIPAIDPSGQLGFLVPGGRSAIIRQINEELFLRSANRHVSILDSDHVASTYGKANWTDAAHWFTSKQYPSPGALPALVDAQVIRIKVCLGQTKKVLVLDLDNTLWGGVIGEEGVNGVQIGPPSAAGEAHLALQHYVSQLKERGILLAVCSKNNEADAKGPFLEHPAMHLRLKDFAAFTANWLDKPTNLRNMAKTLNLGLESFVFVDDNPIERALIRKELPQVAVPEMSDDPAWFVEDLHRSGYFEVDFLSSEDLGRNQNYLDNQQRDILKTKTSSLEDFLQELDMVCDHGPIDDATLARVVQLIGKTNQFNLTTRRHGEGWVRNIMADSRSWTHRFRLKDKFGDNGLVGVLVTLPMPDKPGVWLIDTWLMSCRVIGRQLENYMFNTLITAAREHGIEAIMGLYAPTAKNGLVEKHYQSLGFSMSGTAPDGTQEFILELGKADMMPARFIREEP